MNVEVYFSAIMMRIVDQHSLGPYDKSLLGLKEGAGRLLTQSRMHRNILAHMRMYKIEAICLEVLTQ